MHNGTTESHHELSPHDEPVMESGTAPSRGATFLLMRPCGQCPRRGAPCRPCPGLVAESSAVPGIFCDVVSGWRLVPGDAICWNGSFVTGPLSSRGTSLGGPWCPLACESRVLMQLLSHVSVTHDELGGSLVIGGLVVV